MIKNRYTTENDQLNHTLAVFRNEGKYRDLEISCKIEREFGNFEFMGSTKSDLDHFMESTEFLSWIEFIRPGIYKASLKKSNLKSSTYSNTDWKIKKSVRFVS